MADELLFGGIALQEGFLTRAQLNEALQDQHDRPLGEVLLEKNYLTEAQIQAILDIQKIHLAEAQAATLPGGLFGQIALQEGYITRRQLNQAVREQRRLREDGRFIFLGQLMVDRGFLSEDRCLRVLDRQDKRALCCPECETYYVITGYPPGTKFICRKCLRLLTLPALAILSPLFPAGSRANALPPLSLQPGSTLGQYQVLSEIGRGAMSVVFKARNRDFNSVVALKVLKEIEGLKPDVLRRFEREAHAACRLFHPNIVAIRDSGRINGVSYIALEYIEGVTLHQALMERKLRRDELLDILEKTARAVHFAHLQGVIHRDLKPANVMIDAAREPHIMDFGLAKLSGRPGPGGASLGTPCYMSPEQADGDVDGTDARSDIYSLGVILYEILTGRVPHTGATLPEIYRKILTSTPPAPTATDPRITPELEAVCLDALRRDKNDRYRTALELAENLHRARVAIPAAC